MRTVIQFGQAVPLGFAVLSLASCGAKMKQEDPRVAARARSEAKRQQSACASPSAYERLKNVVFDQAIDAREGDRTNLDTLADYSLVRMESPVVAGVDLALDQVRCKGRLIVEVPPGAERGLAGQRRLEAQIDYSAQAAADNSGFVYKMEGADEIVHLLAGFNLPGMAYRPPPAIDGPGGRFAQSTPPSYDAVVRNEPSYPPPIRSRDSGPAIPLPGPGRNVAREMTINEASGGDRPGDRISSEDRSEQDRSSGDQGERTVKGFYSALSHADGATASSFVIPEKRSSQAYSAQAIERFYGGLHEPLRLTGVAPQGGGAYRVAYRYSTGRSQCNGKAIVNLTQRDGQSYIRSIRALGGC